MALKTKHQFVDTSYFVTFTCFNWLPLFEITNLYDDIYRWFEKLSEDGNSILGYVIMSNHLHFLIKLGPESKTINHLIAEGKRFRSYEIVKRLKKMKQHELLSQLTDGLTLNEKRKGSKHKVFISSFDCKECYSGEFIQQKLKYMHYNPVKAGIVKSEEQYIHSSANFYNTGATGVYPVKSYLEFYNAPIGN
jgi:REP element-mobilizing transposase RayT